MSTVETKFLDCLFEDRTCHRECLRPSESKEMWDREQLERVSWLDGLVEDTLRGKVGLTTQMLTLSRCGVLKYSPIVQSLRSGETIDLGLVRALKAVAMPRTTQTEEGVYEVSGMDNYLSGLNQDNALRLLTVAQSLVVGWKNTYFKEYGALNKDTLWSNARSLVARGLNLGWASGCMAAGIQRYFQGEVGLLSERETQVLLSNGGVMVYSPNKDFVSYLA